MQRLSAMHYFDYPAFVALAKRIGYTTVDMNEVALRNGHFISKKQTRQHLRALLRRFGLEHLAYRMQRAWYVGMFELALTKEA
jgi:sugar phosphate isomerase/epimerase